MQKYKRHHKVKFMLLLMNNCYLHVTEASKRNTCYVHTKQEVLGRTYDLVAENSFGYMCVSTHNSCYTSWVKSN